MKRTLLSLWRGSAESGIFSKRQQLALSLYEEYKGICHVCKNKIPHPIRDLDKLNTRNVLNLDHVVPRSIKRGIKGNLFPSHAYCNTVRGNGIINNELLDRIRKNFNYEVL